MPMKLTYTATLTATDADFNPDGLSFTFTGSQVFGGATPATGDLQTLASAMGSDISAQMVAKFPVMNAVDSSIDQSGGQG